MSIIAESNIKNRRRSQRRRPRTTIKVQCRKGSHGLGADLAVSVLDLSDSGVRLVIKDPVDCPSEIEVTISGYGMRQPLKRTSNVRWMVKLENGSFCIGAEFQKRIEYREWQALVAAS